MTDPAQKVKAELEKSSNLSIVAIIDNIIEHAFLTGASDIHLDPQEKYLRVRLRLDGVLQTVYSLPRTIYNETISRVKVLSNLRTDQHQIAQDGRFSYVMDGSAHLDIRVSIIPTYFGENVIMRLLNDTNDKFTLDNLGYQLSEINKIKKALRRPHGMILVTGPTGSGKTTTLYTCLKLLNNDDISIITIEDPIEYAIAGITQIQTNSKHGLTFATGLRSILRQDPDLIMVGEIRDTETANIAVNSALTGHLLFSTLHTNDAVSTLPRLSDIGVEPYLIASTVNLIISQRLLRQNCKYCSVKKNITDTERSSLTDVFPDHILSDLVDQKVGSGCDKCNNTGFNGRLSINEVLEIDESIRESIIKKESNAKLKYLAEANGMTPMIENGITKVRSGDTTVKEVLRVINY